MKTDSNPDICDILLDKMLQFIDNHKTIMISLYILVSLLVIIYNIIPQQYIIGKPSGY